MYMYIYIFIHVHIDVYIVRLYMFRTCSRFQMLSHKSTIYIDTNDIYAVVRADNGLNCLPQVEEWNTQT